MKGKQQRKRLFFLFYTWTEKKGNRKAQSIIIQINPNFK